MPNILDKYINRTGLHNVVIQALTGLVAVTLILSAMGKLLFMPLPLLLSLLLLVSVSIISNQLFATARRIPTTYESAVITALILFFILMPAETNRDALINAGVAVIAMGSKYFVTARQRHIFNPAAIGLVIGGLFFGATALWWTATPLLLPFVIMAGGLIVLKVRRADLAITFLLTSVPVILILHSSATASLSENLSQVLTSWPIFFFAAIMLTEPATTPATKKMRLAYGVLVGVLFGLAFRIGNFSTSPEMALVVGNLLVFLSNPYGRVILTFKEKIHLTGDLYEFVFTPNRPLKFQAGQFLEWMVPAERNSGRGIRGYFTIASSPTEKEMRLGTKLPPTPGPFKRGLLALAPGDKVTAGQLAGDFILPTDKNEPLVLIAGGIGITPFRSMVQYLLDQNETRNATLIYQCKSAEEFAYKPIFDSATRIGLKVYYQTDLLTPEILKKLTPNLTKSRVYISGPNGMVNAYKKMVKVAGLPSSQLETDYFPGY